MIDIVTIKGDTYSFDETNQRIFKNGIAVSSSLAEPIFSNFNKEDLPTFCGIHLKDRNSILSLSGNISPVTDINSIK